jgi:hypothetical protein
MRPFLITVGSVVLIIGAVAVSELTGSAALAWAIIVIPVALVIARNLAHASRRRRGLVAAPGGQGVGKSTDNYNLDSRRLIERMRRPLFWVVMLPLSAAAVLLPLLVDPDGPWIVVAVVCFLLLWVVASVAVPMLPTGGGSLGAFAERQGLRRAGDAAGPTPALSGTSLHSAGAGQRTTETLVGERVGLQFSLFRLSFEHHSAAGTNLVQFTTIVVDTGIPDFPEFAIDNREIYDLAEFLPRADFERLSLEGSFGQRFSVLIERGDSSDKRLLALSLVAPDFMAIYEDHFARASLLSQGGKFVLITPEDLFFAASLDQERDRRFDRVLDGLTLVLRTIDRQVRIRTAVRDIDEQLASFARRPAVSG